MYNAMITRIDNYKELLEAIYLPESMIPRFRDCYLSPDLERIIVYTRTGGNNRNSYTREIDFLKSNKYYLKDYDDSFDKTYMSFEFKIPEDKLEYIKNKFKDSDTRTGEQKFHDLMEAFEKDPDKAMTENEGLRKVTMNLQQMFESEKDGGMFAINPDGTIDKM